MKLKKKQAIHVAILDLYSGWENQGMRCIRDIVAEFGMVNDYKIISREFDVRQDNKLPDTDFDIYISTGGPGSPVESEGLEWDTLYFEWLKKMEKWNADPDNSRKKFIFFICHSFQLACRHFKIADLAKRKSAAFGVFPVHLLQDGKNEPIFDGMADPFYAVDSRDYQVIRPDHSKIQEMGAKILCIEKERPHVPYERAIMGVRFNDYFIGTQFHPEADAVGMRLRLQTDEKKKTVVENYGFPKWESMIDQLNDPEKILWTHDHILPNFLDIAINNLNT
ncbi:MAG: GMP synthase [Ginsengibacter sp.]